MVPGDSVAIDPFPSTPSVNARNLNCQFFAGAISQELRDARVKQGRCVNCGMQLFKLTKQGFMLNKKTVLVPLTVDGLVKRGQCLTCPSTEENRAELLTGSRQDEEGDLVLALAFSSMENNQTVIPTVAINQVVHENTCDSSPAYRGEFNLYGERHGWGEMVSPNGDRYVGEFFNGNRHGEGTMSFTDGSEYVGQWECNFMHGKGTRRFKNGDTFIGLYADGKRSGEGRMYFSNGDLYQGEWHEDYMHGFGRYYYNHGQSFEGMFFQGMRHGKGKYQFADGKIHVHKYENDQREGEGVRWSANRKQAWRLIDGKVKGRISLEQAVEITARCEE